MLSHKKTLESAGISSKNLPENKAQPICLTVVIEIRAYQLRAAWGQVLRIQRLISCQPQISLSSTAAGLRNTNYPLTVSQVRRTEENGPLTLERLLKLWQFFSDSQNSVPKPKSEVKIMRVESGGRLLTEQDGTPSLKALAASGEDFQGE